MMQLVVPQSVIYSLMSPISLIEYAAFLPSFPSTRTSKQIIKSLKAVKFEA